MPNSSRAQVFGLLTEAGVSNALILGKNKDFLDIIAERIRARGMDVSTVTAVEDALNMVAEESYDVVIMDFMMPGMNGFQTLKALKVKKPELQIILLTGNVPDDKRIEAKALGALDVIEKPPDLKDLIGKIKSVKAHKTVDVKKGG
ncbi:MAG: response regulator [Desulfobacterales bacterium]|jgi:DNA-binding response OmpR family regulator